MDPPPPLSAAAVVAAPPHLNFPDSADSSPRSRNTDSWDEQSMPTAPGGGGGGFAKLRLMCSYGGRIVPRPHDKSLCYVGGDTRMVVVDRHSTLPDLTNRLSKTLLNGRSFNLKYQLPNEDLDSLISVTTDEDLDNMIEEHDRLHTTAHKSCRLRLFLFPSKSDSDSVSSIGSLLENSTKSEDWFLNALNGATGDSATMNCLLGLGDDVSNSSVKDVEAQLESFGKVKGVSGSNSGKLGVQDVQSVPDSPMMEKNSSFGSTSSSPSLTNLPPIRVHVDDQKVVVGEIEEQFLQMSVEAKQDHGGLGVLVSHPTVLTSAAAMAASGVPVGTTMVTDEYPNWVFSYDERSEQVIPIGYRTQQQPQSQTMPPQSQLKTRGGLDLPSPESVSSDGSIPNQMSRGRPMIYQDPVVQITSRNNRISVNPVDPNLSDPNSRVQMQQQQQLQDSGFVLVNQFDQQHQQSNPQQQQQFIQAGTHYIHHHQTGAVPITSYYPIYSSHQQQQQHHHHHYPHHALDQQYPVYYMPAREHQAYNLSVQPQSSYSEAAAAVPSSQPHTASPPAMIPASAAVYKTATAAASPPLAQVTSSQHQPQYVGFSQIHYESQSVAPPSAANANYAYQFADPAHAQIYYTQPLAPELASHYQTMTSAPAVVLPETSDQLPTDRIKQQIRTSQP